MQCQKCNAKCACVDSRRLLTYGIDRHKPEEKPALRERKYACPKCGMCYLTKEHIVQTYVGNTKDRRALRKGNDK